MRAQHKLVTERFGIERLVAMTGWSMGADQAFQRGRRRALADAVLGGDAALANGGPTELGKHQRGQDGA